VAARVVAERVASARMMPFRAWSSVYVRENVPTDSKVVYLLKHKTATP